MLLAGDEIVLDTRGKKCPRPFTDLVRALIRLRGRGTVRVYTDDESRAPRSYRSTWRRWGWRWTGSPGRTGIS